MANKTLQFLRNSVIFENRAAALTGIKAQLASAPDGSPVIARYNTTVGDKTVERTLFGIAGLTAGQYEIFDNQGDNDAINTAIQNLIGGADEGFDTLKEIQDKIEAMDLTAVGGGDGDVITTVSEADGKVSATKASLSDIVLTGYAKTSATGAIAATDTLEGALSKLENKTAAITVASADNTVKVTSPAGGGTDLAVNIDGTTIVKNGSGVLKADLTVTQLTADEVTALSDSNVKEAYKLIYSTDDSRTAIGSVVKIYKDSALYSAYLGHVDDTITSETNPTVVPGTGSEALCFIYQKADGVYQLVAVNVESFLQESEFKNGLQVINNEVSVKKDATSGKVRTAAGDAGLVDVITISSEGVKINNIQEAIDYAVTTATDGLDYNDTAVTHKFVTEVDESNGVISVQRAQPTASDIATTAVASDTTHVAIDGTDAATQITNIAAAIKSEETARIAAIQALDKSDTAVTDQFVTAVSESDGIITVLRARPTAANVAIVDSSDYFDATNVEAALSELATFNCGTY